MTNFEWIKSLDMAQLAKFLMDGFRYPEFTENAIELFCKNQCEKDVETCDSRPCDYLALHWLSSESVE